jgi:hypothetical protein
LSVEPLYRLHGDSASFRKRDAVEKFGYWMVSEAWRLGLRPWQAEDWAQQLVGLSAREVWSDWDDLVEREEAACRPPTGGRSAGTRSTR